MIKPIIIFGQGRSGTSWVGKIFDSHPDTFYRHEPDIAQKNLSIPFVISPDQYKAYSNDLKLYFANLFLENSLRTNANFPIFDKSYRGKLAFLMRSGFIYGGRVVESLLKPFRIDPLITVPDFVHSSKATSYVPVLKIVSSVTRIPTIFTTSNTFRFVHVIRHPGAVIASLKRG